MSINQIITFIIINPLIIGDLCIIQKSMLIFQLKHEFMDIYISKKYILVNVDCIVYFLKEYK